MPCRIAPTRSEAPVIPVLSRWSALWPRPALQWPPLTAGPCGNGLPSSAPPARSTWRHPGRPHPTGLPSPLRSGGRSGSETGAQFDCGRSSRFPHGLECDGKLGIRPRWMMSFDSWQLGQGCIYALAGGIVLDVLQRNCPGHHSPHPLTHPPRCLGLLGPDRGQQANNICPGYLIHRPAANERMGICRQRGSPLRSVLGVAPRRAQGVDVLGRQITKIGYRRLALLKQWVSAGPGFRPVCLGPLPSFLSLTKG